MAASVGGASVASLNHPCHPSLPLPQPKPNSNTSTKKFTGRLLHHHLWEPRSTISIKSNISNITGPPKQLADDFVNV